MIHLVIINRNLYIRQTTDNLSWQQLNFVMQLQSSAKICVKFRVTVSAYNEPCWSCSPIITRASFSSSFYYVVFCAWDSDSELCWHCALYKCNYKVISPGSWNVAPVSCTVAPKRSEHAVTCYAQSLYKGTGVVSYIQPVTGCCTPTYVDFTLSRFDELV